MRQFLRRIWYLLRWRRRDAELREEMAFHRAAIEHALRDQGADARDERLSAARTLGSTALAGDAARDVWTPRCLQGLGQDIRLALRNLRATPLITAVAVGSLALGIGANGAIFSIIDSLVLRALPVRDPARLVLITDSDATRLAPWNGAVWEQFRRQTAIFEQTAAWSFTRFNLAATGEAQFVDGVWASGSFFDTLGVSTPIGRTFSDADDRAGGGDAGLVAVLSYDFWRDRFAGSPAAIGQTLRLDGAAFTVVGVAPPGFLGPEVGRAFKVIVPLNVEPLVRGHDSRLVDSGTRFLSVIARLPDGEPLVIGSVVALLLVGVCASGVPAWRASRVDPALVLRQD